ncbi:MAG: aminotransferase class III-fold pyridoxal phosphate-dependent enzyme [Spirochaetota bacterium]
MDTQNFDLRHHWMPFTANRAFQQDPRLITKAEGVYYWDQRGNQIFDASSGLFTTSAGHKREEIIDAVYRQLNEVDYVPHFNLGHPSSFELSKLITDIAPAGFSHVFFANSGSEAIDSSIKMIHAYWRSKNEAQRQIFVSRARAYHGVNLGGTSLGGMLNNKRVFPGLPGVLHMRHTLHEKNRFRWGEGEEGGLDFADDLERIAEVYGGENIAACYVEPVSGSIGSYVPPKNYLKRLREICDRYQILLVFDEVITGFGKTGEPFAAQTFDVNPDVITIAKSLTNGVIPMGGVLVKDELYRTVAEQAKENAIELFHGYTYSAHPVACAAGIATQKIYIQEKLFERVSQLAPHFEKAMLSLRSCDLVTDIRGIGLMGAFDLAPLDNTPGKRGRVFCKRLFEHGVHIKFTGDTPVLALPFIVNEEQIAELFHVIREQLELLC